VVAACVDRGHPRCDSYETEGVIGVAPAGLTRREGRRVSTNDAYLEPARGRSNLEIRGDVLVDRVLVENGRATGVRTSDGTVMARRVVLSAGAIHSPAILLRSGLDTVRPAIGQNLAEHPALFASLNIDPSVIARDGDTPSSGFLLRWSSDLDGCGEADLQISPISHTETPGLVRILAAVMEPFSRGAVTLVSDDPTVDPRIEFHLLSDSRDLVRMRLGHENSLRYWVTTGSGASPVRSLSTSAGQHPTTCWTRLRWTHGSKQRCPTTCTPVDRAGWARLAILRRSSIHAVGSSVSRASPSSMPPSSR
jgi:choline dehydrogenase-like flavoprotein